jgi:hypothetical protein
MPGVVALIRGSSKFDALGALRAPGTLGFDKLITDIDRSEQ